MPKQKTKFCFAELKSAQDVADAIAKLDQMAVGDKVILARIVK
jgi:hypothetical protein